MKIIRITTLLDFGGQERKYLNFTKNPALLSNEYVFASIGKGGHASRLLEKRGFRVKVFNGNHSIGNLKNIWLLYKWFKKEKPDVVHAAAAEANFHGVIAAKLAGVPKIFAEEIGVPEHSKKAIIAFNLVYRLADGVICVAKAVKDHLVKIGELKPEKGIVIYNPISKPKEFPRKQNEHFQLVYVGRLEVVKNVEFLINAFAKLNNKERFFLTIVGEGTTRPTIEAMIEKENLSNFIELVGFCEEPEQYVSQADLLILPSHSEGFGNAAVEAMFQGVPCLCSNVGGIPEFIEEGKTGWLFSPKNQKVFLDKLEMIYRIPKSELQKIGYSGKQHVTKNFTTEIYIQNLQKIYNG